MQLQQRSADNQNIENIQSQYDQHLEDAEVRYVAKRDDKNLRGKTKKYNDGHKLLLSPEHLSFFKAGRPYSRADRTDCKKTADNDDCYSMELTTRVLSMKVDDFKNFTGLYLDSSVPFTNRKQNVDKEPFHISAAVWLEVRRDDPADNDDCYSMELTTRVLSMKVDDFKNFTGLYLDSSVPFTNRKQNVDKEPFYISAAVWLEVRRDDPGILFYKNNFTQESIKSVNLNKSLRKIVSCLLSEKL
ncbi:hypothetical protein ILUMI_07568 [Ignelater luminosus]|uniref:Uncharacterized protein n=1 Tax=Ignelater luminosus TaxID=2038154 RepID=A0A8K0D7U6_IGNLU|nr:hypothetical protein ILUMI_07568 [Ignelater luminosus]